MTTIITKNSSTASAVPTAGQLVQGELAVNVTDRRLFTENASGTVVELGTNPSSLTLSNGVANAVCYLNGSKVLTTGSALQFDGTNLGIGTSSPSTTLDVASAAGSPIISLTASGAWRYQILTDRSTQTFRIRDQSAGNLDRVILDTSGNLGLGVTPSAWGSGQKAIEIGPAANGFLFNDSNNVNLGANAYYNAGWKYQTSSVGASRYAQSSGGHTWYTAPSGTAGNAITFTQAMTLDASGNLLIGTTSGTNLTLGSGTFTIKNASGDSFGMRLYQDTGDTSRIYNYYNGPLAFGTNNTERARIDASGNLLVGTTSVTSVLNAKLYVNGGINLPGNTDISGTNGLTPHYGSGSFIIYSGLPGSGTERARIDSSGNFYMNVTSGAGGTPADAGHIFEVNGNCKVRTNGDNSYFQFYNSSGTQVGGITTNGTTTAYNTSSDYRLKENIQPMTGALAKVAALKPCTYKWKADGSDGEGFIAHELAEVCPQAVTGEKDAVDADGNPVYQGIDTSFLVATLTAAIQEQQAIITALTSRVQALEAK